MQIIEERFKKGEKGNGWDAFTRMMESGILFSMGIKELHL
jgi:hypothetical protein